MKRIIIAGGRDFQDVHIMEEAFHKLTPGLKPEDAQIVSGGARGADALAVNLAIKYGTNYAVFPAQWGAQGKSAGYKRNLLMAKNADMLIAFWDGKSKGTGHMIDIATRASLEVHIINY